ncbi:MAG: recombinase family protein, partial [Bacteroidales bacterium]
MKAAIYIRVSTQLQSTDRQRTELTEYANKQGYQVVNIYED